jgi:hypothetical protein
LLQGGQHLERVLMQLVIQMQMLARTAAAEN